MPAPVKATFVDFDFLNDFEEDEKGSPLVYAGTNRCIVRPRSAKGALLPGTIHWGNPYEGARERGHRCMAFVCPCGCGEHDFVVAAPAGGADEANRAWQWDGNLESPTLAPSVYRVGAACKWHGWLTKGEWISC